MKSNLHCSPGAIELQGAGVVYDDGVDSTVIEKWGGKLLCGKVCTARARGGMMELTRGGSLS